MTTEKKFKYHLRSGSAKEVCPNCGQRTFVPYVDDAEQIVGELYGRCDRENKCGYYRYPRGVVSNAIIKPVAIDDSPRLTFSPNAYMRFGASPIVSNLYIYAISCSHEKGVARVLNIFNAYRVKSWQGYVLFPQFDINNDFRSAKMIKYQDNGHRSHEQGASTWLHALKDFRYLHNKGKLEQCFFGEHLLDPERYKQLYKKDITKDTPVFVVESEKTALMMAIHSASDGVWLACGGSQMLKNAKRNKVLEGRNVTLIPDNGQFWNWKSTADKYGWKIISSIENFRWNGLKNPPTTEGWDIWDVWEFLLKFKTEDYEIY